MKLKQLCVFVLVCVSPQVLHATSIDATSVLTNAWQSSSYYFNGSEGDQAIGIVKFLDGFEVRITGSVTLDISKSIDGTIDCNETGRIILNGHLAFAPNIAIANNLTVDGRGHTIILEGDLTIPEGKTLHVTSTTDIDGCGNTLYLEPHANISLDNNATLTLRNMRVKNMRNNSANPMIRPSGHRAQVALQNIELALADDFMFRDGQLFIHDDVIVTGSSIFSYRSTQTSYICDASTFAFDKNTTFEYYPGTIDNSLIQMQSETATLYLDGATLQATHTGMRLSKGRLCFDNNVLLSSTVGTKLTSLTGVASKNMGTQVDDDIFMVAWSPDGKYLAVGVGVDPSLPNPSDGGVLLNYELRIYGFDGQTLTGITSKDMSGDVVRSIDWSPDGKYLAVGTNNDPNIVHENIAANDELRIYSFDGSTLTGVASVNHGSEHVYDVYWSPDGKHIAICLTYDPSLHELLVYSFDGASLTFVDSVDTSGGTPDTTDYVFVVAWHPSGNYIAVGTNNAPSGSDLPEIIANHELRIYSFDVVAGTLAGVTSEDIGNIDVRDLSWSPDGTHLAVVMNVYSVGEEGRVYSFLGESLALVRSVELGAVNGLTVDWSPDGKYIAFGRLANSGQDELVVYRYDDFSSPVEGRYTGLGTRSVAWSSDGNYLAVGIDAGSSTNGGDSAITAGDELRIYRANYGAETDAQTFGKGILLGDSSPTGDALDVQVLAGAQVAVDGYVTVDK